MGERSALEKLKHGLATLPGRFKHYLTSQPETRNPESFRTTLSKLVLVRVVILTLLLGANAWGILVTGKSHDELALVFWLIGATYAVSLLNILLLRHINKLWTIGYAQLGVDVLLSTLAIYFTGGTASPLIFLYLIVIVGGALLLSHKGAVIIAAFSGLCYAVITTGALPALDGNAHSTSAQHLLAVYISLVVIALVSGYLARQLENVWNIAHAHQKQFSELSNHQKQLFDDISEGIITLDMQGTVTSINKAACSIIGLAEADATRLVGESFSDVMRRLGINNAYQTIVKNLNSPEPGELTIVGSSLGREICLSYVARPLIDGDGVEQGRIVFFNDVSHVRSMEKRLLLHEQMTKLLAQPSVVESSRHQSAEGRICMVGESQIMRQVLSLVERVSKSEASVLITGESGTGKELIARAIHTGGDRASKPFVAINCGAIPENLIESELFGHKKGSFTGAHSDQPGLFRQAQGGTIFLDEIGDLPLQMQTKLLRVLQEKSIRAVGDVKDVAIDVRVISATNRDLKAEIAKGAFREDLFYRLNVVNVVVPPLRSRQEDIPLLVRYFMGRFSDPSKPLPQISPEALELLSVYPFPGNVRELENIIERALVLGGNAILSEHLPDEVIQRGHSRTSLASPSVPADFLTSIHLLPIDLEGELAKLEQHYLRQALDQTGGLKKQAAELLGLNFRSFRYRLKKYGLGETNF